MTTGRSPADWNRAKYSGGISVTRYLLLRMDGIQWSRYVYVIKLRNCTRMVPKNESYYSCPQGRYRDFLQTSSELEVRHISPITYISRS
jgi:hypothetical protein